VVQLTQAQADQLTKGFGTRIEIFEVSLKTLNTADILQVTDLQATGEERYLQRPQ
jgi:uncharacterized protein YjdB